MRTILKIYQEAVRELTFLILDHCILCITCSPATIFSSDKIETSILGQPPRSPELVTGRIVGNTAAGLVRAIKTSNAIFAHPAGDGFSRTKALLVGGTDSNNSDLENSFVNVVNKTATLISPEFNVKKLQMSALAGHALQKSEFKANIANQDVMLLCISVMEAPIAVASLTPQSSLMSISETPIP